MKVYCPKCDWLVEGDHLEARAMNKATAKQARRKAERRRKATAESKRRREPALTTVTIGGKPLEATP